MRQADAMFVPPALSNVKRKIKTSPVPLQKSSLCPGSSASLSAFMAPFPGTVTCRESRGVLVRRRRIAPTWPSTSGDKCEPQSRCAAQLLSFLFRKLFHVTGKDVCRSQCDLLPTAEGKGSYVPPYGKPVAERVIHVPDWAGEGVTHSTHSAWSGPLLHFTRGRLLGRTRTDMLI